jgi:hypothetical protein
VYERIDIAFSVFRILDIDMPGDPDVVCKISSTLAFYAQS